SATTTWPAWSGRTSRRPASRSSAAELGPRLRQVVLGEKLPEVPVVQQLDLHVRIELPQAPQLAVLARDQALLHPRDLDVEVEVGDVEVGREALGHAPVLVPGQVERARLVLPAQPVEVEQPREGALAL